MRFKLLLEYFESADKAWNAPVSELRRIGLGEILTAKFEQFRREFSLQGYTQKVKDLGIAVLTLRDEKYPRLLAQIPDAPFLLYIKGKKEPGKVWDIERAVGVVGTRRITSYGVKVTQTIVQGLVDSGVTIVSGLALGVDAVAHEAALEAGGKTIAVLGCGVDCCYPQSNQNLYDRIAGGGGMIISEFPLSKRTAKGLFPARNRIISGLSQGIVVTEGAEDSGALITASYAGEQGRDVFAVPGPVTSQFSKAPNALLKKGAKLAESAADILEELGFNQTKKSQRKVIVPEGATPEERAIITLLISADLHQDEIIRKLSFDSGVVASTLSLLEIKGMVRNDGGVYSLNVKYQSSNVK